MTETLLIIVLVLLVVVAAFQLLLWRRKIDVDLSPIQAAITTAEKSYERTDRSIRDEIGKSRDESSNMARQSREELATTLKTVGEGMTQQIIGLTKTNDQKLERVRETLDQRLQAIQKGTNTSAQGLREEVVKSMTGLAEAQQKQMQGFSEQLGKLSDTNGQKFEALKAVVETKLKEIQEDNSKQLERMRATVDEKLQGTLEKRLGESFKLVSDRLEQVYKGLGEMQTLAAGVGDLKKVLTNVKSRGTWGEVQLGALLEQVLTPEQYEANVSPRGNGERVEFAVKLPGRSDDDNEVLWLPIDAKFPIEDYQRLVEAQEQADAVAAEQAANQLEARIKQCAKDISAKYLSPPRTTDFAILFLPAEGLFAEVLRRKGLSDFLQTQCRVMIAGPTTLWSLLNSLQMGFRTLAVQKRSSEVWKLLAAVKTEWSKYGDVLRRVQKKLEEASNTVEDAQTRTRVIGRKLKDVQELPSADANVLLALDAAVVDDGEPGCHCIAEP